MGEEKKCERCGLGMTGTEFVPGADAYWVNPTRIRGTPEQVESNFYGGEYECPHCGAVHTLLLMPAMGDPSPQTAHYELRIMTKIGE